MRCEVREPTTCVMVKSDGCAIPRCTETLDDLGQGDDKRPGDFSGTLPFVDVSASASVLSTLDCAQSISEVCGDVCIVCRTWQVEMVENPSERVADGDGANMELVERGELRSLPLEARSRNKGCRLFVCLTLLTFGAFFVLREVRDMCHLMPVSTPCAGPTKFLV